jgi:hypothetical protein
MAGWRGDAGGLRGGGAGGMEGGVVMLAAGEGGGWCGWEVCGVWTAGQVWCVLAA